MTDNERKLRNLFMQRRTQIEGLASIEAQMKFTARRIMDKRGFSGPVPEISGMVDLLPAGSVRKALLK